MMMHSRNYGTRKVHIYSKEAAGRRLKGYTTTDGVFGEYRYITYIKVRVHKVKSKEREEKTPWFNSKDVFNTLPCWVTVRMIDLRQKR